MEQSPRVLSLWAASAFMLFGSAVISIATRHDPDDAPMPVPRIAEPRRDGLDARLPAPTRPRRVAIEPTPERIAAADSADRRYLQWEAWYASTSRAEMRQRLEFLAEYVTSTKATEFAARFDRGQVDTRLGEWDEHGFREVRIPGSRGRRVEQVTLSRAEYPELYARYDELVWLHARIVAETPPPGP